MIRSSEKPCCTCDVSNTEKASSEGNQETGVAYTLPSKAWPVFTRGKSETFDAREQRKGLPSVTSHVTMVPRIDFSTERCLWVVCKTRNPVRMAPPVQDATPNAASRRGDTIALTSPLMSFDTSDDGAKRHGIIPKYEVRKAGAFHTKLLVSLLPTRISSDSSRRRHYKLRFHIFMPQTCNSRHAGTLGTPRAQPPRLQRAIHEVGPRMLV